MDDNKKQMKLKHAIMLLLMLIGVMGMALSCSPKIVETIVEKEKVVYRDSTAYRDTTIYYPIPLEKDQAIVHVGDTSRRETSLAHSEAWVGEDGMLHHSLENKRGNIPVVVSIPSRTIWVETTAEKTQTLTKVEFREKPLSKCKSFKLAAFWWLIVAVLLLLLWTFRKPIMNLIKLMIV